jgi:hypothetical protein
VDANFSTRVKMGQSSNVFAVAMMNDGKALFAREGDQGHAGRLRRLSPPQPPTRHSHRRTTWQTRCASAPRCSGDKATVRVLMSHEMETGQRRDPPARRFPAWFIQK